jgi:hypothetical protein
MIDLSKYLLREDEDEKIIAIFKGSSGGGGSSGTTPPATPIITNVSYFGSESIYTPQSGGQVVYVDVNAADDTGDGSIGDPYQDLGATLFSSSTRVGSGDVIVIRGGTYNLTSKLRTPGLVATPRTLQSERVVVQNYPGEHVILDGTNIAWSQPGTISFREAVIATESQTSYDIIEGLDIRNSLKSAIILKGDHSEAKNCRTNRTGASSILTTGTDACIIDNNEVIEGVYLGQEEMITATGTTNTVISNNYVHDIGNDNAHNNGIGIDIKDGCTGARVFGNRVHNTKIVGIYIDARGASNDIEIYNNEVYNIDANSWPLNHGIVVADETPDGVTASSNIKVYNNLMYNTGTNGIAIGWTGFDGEYYQNCQFVNNTIYDTIYGISLYTTSIDGGTTPNPSTGIYISNNIMYNQSGQSIASSGIVNYSSYTVDTNIMSGAPGGLTVTNQLDIDPLFTDAANKDFTLQATSGAINTGLESVSVYQPTLDFYGNPRLVGSSVDLGIYEYQVSDLGPELLTNGDFATGDLTGYGTYNPSGEGTITVVSEQLVFNTTGNDNVNQNGILEIGKLYQFRYDIVSYTSGAPFISSGGDINTTVGSHKLNYTETGTDFDLYGGVFGVGGSVTLDNLSIKEVL